MSPRKTDIPSVVEEQLLRLLSTTGRAQADVARELGEGDVGNRVLRLKRKGLIKKVGTTPCYRAPRSSLIALTPKGVAALRALER